MGSSDALGLSDFGLGFVACSRNPIRFRIQALEPDGEKTILFLLCSSPSLILTLAHKNLIRQYLVSKVLRKALKQAWPFAGVRP